MKYALMVIDNDDADDADDAGTYWIYPFVSECLLFKQQNDCFDQFWI